ncbi:acyl-CoA dehydrogenase family protein [Desulfitobacterium sp.]|uniref:acyl-CoA dehydrogenase family protein n=1 Tax=Desulfitobacterium sp. TaxID=49981 RepID=UPI002B770C7B|nr:acyl-CoA dehydrogenase family protein [Desulfitobacterium sp.]HVJ50234.1 acyl-CoA dehydrogenase family protein [Desulfitobacterium sp.]
MFEFMLNEEQKELAKEVADFVCTQVPKQLILDMDAEKVIYPKEYINSLAKANLLGLRFPKTLGGRGLGWADEVIALEEIGTLGTSLGCLFSLPSIVGEAINKFGSEDLKKRFLQPTLEGKICTAEALTEPRGGSDFFGATTVAVRKGDYYILNGQKRFVVGAEGADYFMVYAKTCEDASPHKSISALLVERGPGVEVGHVYGLMGTRGGGAGRVVFRDVKVPVENLLGVEHGASAIFYQMMIPERMTSAAGALGTARAALEIAARYSTKRKAFGQKIKDFQGVNFKVADSITQLDAARALVYIAARAVDAGVEPGRARRLVSEAKKCATETAWEVVNAAMQIMGGIGYTNIYPIERMLRDTRLIMIWTGTNEIMNMIIQHEYYKQLSAESPVKQRDWEEDAINAHLDEEKIYE